MSAKGKPRKNRHDWSVRTTDGQVHLILQSRITRHRDGGHTFTDRRGVKASFGPGQVAAALREELTAYHPILPVAAADVPAEPFDDDPRKRGTAAASKPA